MMVFIGYDSDDMELLLNSTCEICNRPAEEWVVINSEEDIQVNVYTEEDGHMCGFICPECAKETIIEKEKVGIKVLGVLAANGVLFHIRLLEKGGKYGRNYKLTYDSDKPTVEFYDARYIEKFGFPGQFVSSYYLETLLERDERYDLSLYGNNEDWVIDSKSLSNALDWIIGFVS